MTGSPPRRSAQKNSWDTATAVRVDRSARRTDLSTRTPIPPHQAQLYRPFLYPPPYTTTCGLWNEHPGNEKISNDRGRIQGYDRSGAYAKSRIKRCRTGVRQIRPARTSLDREERPIRDASGQYLHGVHGRSATTAAHHGGTRAVRGLCVATTVGKRKFFPVLQPHSHGRRWTPQPPPRRRRTPSSPPVGLVVPDGPMLPANDNRAARPSATERSNGRIMSETEAADLREGFELISKVERVKGPNSEQRISSLRPRPRPQRNRTIAYPLPHADSPTIQADVNQADSVTQPGASVNEAATQSAMSTPSERDQCHVREHGKWPA